jgi:hypothetical protein
MSQRLSRAEFWLLARLVRYGASLRMLGLPEGPPWEGSTIQELFNCRSHGLSTEGLARCIRGLLSRGWLEFVPSHYARELGPRPSTQKLLAAMTARGRFWDSPYLCLTAAGGHVWQAFARPDLERIVDDSIQPESDEEWEHRDVTVSGPRLLSRYQAAVRAEQEVDSSSERVCEIDDWERLYWQPRCRGLRWTFRARPRIGTIGAESLRLRESWCEWK